MLMPAISLEAGKHGGLHSLGKVVPDSTDTVNAIAKNNAVGHRLDVNISRGCGPLLR